jgi:DNA-directed RNA polymerase alpha subunit
MSKTDPVFVAVPELPDDTPIVSVRLPNRIRNVFIAAGFKPVGEVRETSDECLLSFPDFGRVSLATIREQFGLSSPRRTDERGRHVS